MNWKKIFFIIIIIVIIFLLVKNKDNFGSIDSSGSISDPTSSSFYNITCEDIDSKCNTYDNSECVSNPLYMMENCPNKCQMCNLTNNARNAIINNGTIATELSLGQCKDISNKCGEFIQNNPDECINTSSYMRQYCKNSCGFCNSVEYVDGKLTEYPNDVYSDQYVNRAIPSRAQAVAV